jgi:predicted kinase
MDPILSKPYVIEDKKLSDRFMKACESVLLNPTTQPSEGPITLAALIAKEKKNLNLVFYKDDSSSNGDESVYICMIKSRDDSLLLELAKKYGFPRGLPIIFIEKSGEEQSKLLIGGFYPKFSNDDRSQDVEGKIFDGASKLEGTLKMSGYLAGVTAYRDSSGKIHVIFFSKNSCDYDSPYVQDIRDQIMAKPNVENLLKHIADNGIIVYGEMLSLNDQKHGYCYKRNAFIITAVSEMRIIDNGITKTGDFNFVRYFEPQEIDNFCSVFEMDRTPRFVIDEADIKKFVEELLQSRDFKSLSDIKKLVKKWIGGSVHHEDVIFGNILEGLILKIFYSDGTKDKILKFKFLMYVILTMLFRPLFTTNEKTGLKLVDENTVGNIERFLNSWCISDEGKTYWREIARAVIVAYRNNLVPEVSNIGHHITVSETIMSMSPEEITALAEQYNDHKGTICTMEEIQTLADGTYNVPYDGYKTCNFKIKKIYNPTGDKLSEGILYVVRGLPGSGKSDFAEALSKQIGCSVYEADKVFDALRFCGIAYTTDYLGCSHFICQRNSENDLKKGESVIVSNTSISQKEINVYLAMAKRNCTPLVLIEVSGNFKSVHTIPEKTMNGMIDNLSKNPFEKITEKTISVSGMYPKYTGNTQIRCVVGNNYHITLYFGKDASVWDDFLGEKVTVSYGNVYTLTTDGGKLSCVEVTLGNLSEGFPSTKSNLHVTLECTGIFKPFQSNDLLIGNLVATQENETLEVIPYTLEGKFPLSSTGMIMRFTTSH